MSDFARLMEMAREAGLTPPTAPPPEGTNAPVNVDVPVITPMVEVTVGDTLSCTMGNWEGQPNLYEYLWKNTGWSADQPLVAQGPTYIAMEKDANKDLTCTVTAHNDFGVTTAPPSNAVHVNPRTEAVHRNAHYDARRK